MSSVKAARMTVDEFLAIPDDGIERMLIDGVVRELGAPSRRWIHATVLANLSCLLTSWAWTQPRPRGRVGAGEVGFRLGSGTMVAADVAYASPELAAATPTNQSSFEGSPSLAVEILSPSDRIGDIDDKIATYLDASVPLVWVVHPRFRTVTVYRPDSQPQMFTVHDEIAAEPHLPGFRAAVAAIFED
jgi:Uma2 family endonuclease